MSELDRVLTDLADLPREHTVLRNHDARPVVYIATLDDGRVRVLEDTVERPLDELAGRRFGDVPGDEVVRQVVACRDVDAFLQWGWTARLEVANRMCSSISVHVPLDPVQRALITLEEGVQCTRVCVQLVHDLHAHWEGRLWIDGMGDGPMLDHACWRAWSPDPMAQQAAWTRLTSTTDKGWAALTQAVPTWLVTIDDLRRRVDATIA